MLNFILIPRFGILGAAVATTGAYGILFAMEVVLSRRYLKPRFPVVKSLLAVAVGVGLAYSISSFPHQDWISFFAQVFAFGILYLAGCWILGLITREDAMAIVRLLKAEV